MDSAASDNAYYENLEDDREVGTGKPKVQETSGRASSSTTFVWKILGFSGDLNNASFVVCCIYLFSLGLREKFCILAICIMIHYTKATL